MKNGVLRCQVAAACKHQQQQVGKDSSQGLGEAIYCILSVSLYLPTCNISIVYNESLDAISKGHRPCKRTGLAPL